MIKPVLIQGPSVSPSRRNTDIAAWLDRVLAAGGIVYLPEIIDYKYAVGYWRHMTRSVRRLDRSKPSCYSDNDNDARSGALMGTGTVAASRSPTERIGGDVILARARPVGAMVTTENVEHWRCCEAEREPSRWRKQNLKQNKHSGNGVPNAGAAPDCLQRPLRSPLAAGDISVQSNRCGKSIPCRWKIFSSEKLSMAESVYSKTDRAGDLCGCRMMPRQTSCMSLKNPVTRQTVNSRMTMSSSGMRAKRSLGSRSTRVSGSARRLQGRPAHQALPTVRSSYGLRQPPQSMTMQAKPYTISLGTPCRPHITLTSPSWLPRILLTYLFSLVCPSPQEDEENAVEQY